MFRRISGSVGNIILIIAEREHYAEFKKLNLREIKKSINNKLVIIDGRRMINPYNAETLGLFIQNLLHLRK
jgi:hypothetical protein